MKKILISISFIFNLLYADNIDVNKILIETKNSNKNLLIFVHSPNCSYCRRMISQNFKSKTILSHIEKNFIAVFIDIHDNGKVTFNNFKGSKKEFADHIDSVAVPATTFVDKDGKIIYNFIGYRNIDEYLIELKYISSKSYKEISIESYREKIEFESDD